MKDLKQRRTWCRTINEQLLSPCTPNKQEHYYINGFEKPFAYVYDVAGFIQSDKLEKVFESDDS